MQEIFNNFASGTSIVEICRDLTARQVPTPYNHREGLPYTIPWSVSSVCQMLVDQVYTGLYTSHKVTTASYKNKKRIVHPEDEWIIIENHHPPLIKKELFDTVQRLRNTRRRYTKLGLKSILSGLVFCKDCGSTLSYAMQGANGAYPNFICRSYRSANVLNQHKCTRHGIRVDDLEKLVLMKIQHTVRLAKEDPEGFTRQVQQNTNKDVEKNIKRKTSELEKTEKRIAELDRIITRIYEDNVNGKLTDERFQKMLTTYETEQAALTEATKTLPGEIAELKTKTANLQSFMELVEEDGEIAELTEATARKFVERVVVHEAVFETGTKRKKKSQEVEIHLAYIGQFNIA